MQSAKCKVGMQPQTIVFSGMNVTQAVGDNSILLHHFHKNYLNSIIWLNVTICWRYFLDNAVNYFFKISGILS